ncbi:hypothetical protein [Brevibacillus sp. DP1.3A]|uniref:hypothetical protein n=1 Tax=unclassified Brevibacillus TaxID=2684853 RepID=UPI00156B8B8E|nr:hypothetical protein [Brevibacillus sp. DP1.3A]MED1916106.1 hypothetical protein [Bacillus thuringiensis]UED73924.1 hypothetical protein HP399_024840 [Brevibacillus sp. DP1.3A]
MILEPGDLPVFMFTLISFGSKEEVRIVAFGYPRFVFPYVLGKQSAFFVGFGKYLEETTE